VIVCRECGTENEATATFCRNHHCGAYLGWPARADPEETAATQPGPVVAGEPSAPKRRGSGLFVAVDVETGDQGRPPQGIVALDLWVHPPALQIAPGDRADVEFRVHNGGTVVDQISVTVEDADGWTKVTPPTVNVYPGDTATGRVSVSPPREPKTQAGVKRLVLRARSSEDPSVTATAAVVLTIEPFTEMTGTLVPREVRGRAAKHSVTLKNAGNASIEPSIRVADENNALRATAEPGYAALQPGRSQNVIVRAVPRRRNWIGGPETYRYRVVATERDAPPLEMEAVLTQRAVIPAWAAAAGALILPLIAALIAFILLFTSVPDVGGLDEAAATEQLEAAGLEVKVFRQPSERAEEGTVVRTDPGAGARVREGSEVKLFVSAGARPVAIPNVVGLDAATAQLELASAGVSVKEAGETSEDVAVGIVMATKPAPNLLVPRGSVVQMIVSEGPDGKGEPKPKPSGSAGAAAGEGDEDENGGASDEDEDGAAGDDARKGPTPPYWPASVASNDFDGDGFSDFAIFRPKTGAWRVTLSGAAAPRIVDWPRQRGTDIPVPGDYDGDGRTDFTTWRPQDAHWYFRASGDSPDDVVELGRTGDIPVPADYDDDGTTDFAAWGSEDGKWRIRPSSGDVSAVPDIRWGDRALGDVPVPGDYDGDGKADPAVYRSSNGHWKIAFSGGGEADVPWGDPRAGDIPVAGDYDGDDKFDYAIWRPGNGQWRVRLSGGGDPLVTTWGQRDLLDLPVPGDYTGDGTFDFAIWRESTGGWRIKPSDGTPPAVTKWGQEGDVPL
jgi:hypothetical protein